MKSKAELLSTDLFSDMLHYIDTSKRHLRHVLEHKLLIEKGEEKIQGKKDISECLKGMVKGDYDFRFDKTLPAGASKENV